MELTYYTKTLDENSSVKAEFGVKVPEWGMTLNRLKLIRTKNGGYFTTAPSMKQGEKYVPYWDFDADRKKRFFDAALKLVEDHIKNKNACDLSPSGEEMMF